MQIFVVILGGWLWHPPPTLIGMGRVIMFDPFCLGQNVRPLIDDNMPAVFASIKWDGKDDRAQIVPSGVYVYRIQAGDFSATRKLVLLQ